MLRKTLTRPIRAGGKRENPRETTAIERSLFACLVAWKQGQNTYSSKHEYREMVALSQICLSNQFHLHQGLMFILFRFYLRSNELEAPGWRMILWKISLPRRGWNLQSFCPNYGFILSRGGLIGTRPTMFGKGKPNSSPAQSLLRNMHRDCWQFFERELGGQLFWEKPTCRRDKYFCKTGGEAEDGKESSDFLSPACHDPDPIEAIGQWPQKQHVLFPWKNRQLLGKNCVLGAVQGPATPELYNANRQSSIQVSLIGGGPCKSVVAQSQESGGPFPY